MFEKIVLFGSGMLTFEVLAIFIVVLCEEARPSSFGVGVFCVLCCISLFISGCAAIMKGIGKWISR
jgi:hypothetical protein